MTPKEELEALLEEIAWLEELIEDALDDNGMSIFEEQWLRNMINYHDTRMKKLKKLLKNK